MLIKPTPIVYREKSGHSNMFIMGIQLRDIRFAEAFRVYRGTATYEAASMYIINPLDEAIVDHRWETEKELGLICL